VLGIGFGGQLDRRDPCRAHRRLRRRSQLLGRERGIGGDRVALRVDDMVERFIPHQCRAGHAQRDDQNRERQPDPFVHLKPRVTHADLRHRRPYASAQRRSRL
jgi:hypothetical protein